MYIISVSRDIDIDIDIDIGYRYNIYICIIDLVVGGHREVPLPKPDLPSSTH